MLLGVVDGHPGVAPGDLEDTSLPVPMLTLVAPLEVDLSFLIPLLPGGILVRVRARVGRGAGGRLRSGPVTLEMTFVDLCDRGDLLLALLLLFVLDEASEVTHELRELLPADVHVAEVTEMLVDLFLGEHGGGGGQIRALGLGMACVGQWVGSKSWLEMV